MNNHASNQVDRYPGLYYPKLESLGGWASGSLGRVAFRGRRFAGRTDGPRFLETGRQRLNEGARNDRHRWGTQLVSRFIVRPMVQQRKLIGEVSRHFHHPSSHFRGKPVLQTNGLLCSLSVFGRFWGYQILPNFTNFYQFLPRTCSERPRTGVQTGVCRERFI